MTTGLSLNPAGCDGPLLLEAARRAEAAGFDFVWCYDHLSGAVLGADHCLEVWSTLGAIAAVTERVQLDRWSPTSRPARLRTSPPPRRRCSRCRRPAPPRPGAGASEPSPFAVEMAMFHLEQDGAADRRARVVETIAFLRAPVVRRVLFVGRWASFDDVRGVGTLNPAGPIVVGANGAKMARPAGPFAEGVNVHLFEAGLEGLRTGAGAAEEAGPAGFNVSVEAPLSRPGLDSGRTGPPPPRPGRRGRGHAGLAGGAGLGVIDEAGRRQR